jgi:hypothetical protein
MPSVFPGSLDAFSISHADEVGELVHAATINELADAVNRIEAELGPLPKGGYASVRARLDAASVNALLSGASANDVPVTVRGYTGQTADLAEFQDAGGGVLARFDKRASLNLDAILDGSLYAADNTALYRLSLGLSGINGVNSGRGDSIVSDAANAGGASFFFPVYTNSTLATRGSWANYAGYLTVSDANDGGTPKYREGNVLYANLTTSSPGALSAPIEVANSITAGKPARASGVVVIVSDANTVASYAATVGAGSPWADTGSRGIWLSAQGAQPTGVGVYLDGSGAGFARGIYAYGVSGMNLLAGRVGGQTNDRFTLDNTGLASYGPGTGAYDLTLGRQAAGVLALTTAGSGLQYTKNGAADIAAGGAGSARVYARDNGAGKTQLVVRFDTGAVQVLATQP